MDKEKIIKFLIPVAAVLVIIESVVLVSGALKKKSEVTVEETVDSAPIQLSLTAEKASLSVGEELPVSFKLVTSEERAVDAIETYIKFDPTAFEVSGLTFDNDLPQPTIAKVSRQKGMILVTYLVDEPSGYQLVADTEVALANFSLTAKKSGSYDLEITTSLAPAGSASMVVDSANSEVIPFEVSNLKVNVL